MLLASKPNLVQVDVCVPYETVNPAITEIKEIVLPNDKLTLTSELQFVAVHHAEGSLVHLRGRVDIDSSPALRNFLHRLLQDNPQENVRIDLAEVSYMDTSGIATLIEALKIARHRNVSLKLQRLHGRLQHLLEVTGVLSLFVTPSTADDHPASRGY